MTQWVPVEERNPPVRSDDPYRSENVLVSDGSGIRIGYRITWEDDEFPPEWKLLGADCYTEENITHWALLPTPPSNQGRRCVHTITEADVCSPRTGPLAQKSLRARVLVAIGRITGGDVGKRVYLVPTDDGTSTVVQIESSEQRESRWSSADRLIEETFNRR